MASNLEDDIEGGVRRYLLRVLTIATVLGLGAALAPGAAADKPSSSGPCDEDSSVAVSYLLESGDPRLVSAVVLSDLSDACRHANVKVSLYDEAGDELVALQRKHNSASDELTLDIDDPVSAAAVRRVDVVIAGAKHG
ncbi:MAG: hypothetical protein R3320_09270 [Nitriliruptorales bacterium]|nr:hypothetical protein [Nitriliruptorales bacterium]